MAACLVEIDETSNENFFTVFPNPVSNSLTLNAANPVTDQTNIILTDVRGKTVLEQKMSQVTTLIDVHFLPRGVYFLRIFNNDKILVEKIIKE